MTRAGSTTTDGWQDRGVKPIDKLMAGLSRAKRGALLKRRTWSLF